MGLELDKVQKEIVSVVNNNPGIGQKGIREEVGLPKSTASRKINSLKEKNVIQDKSFKPNKSKYYVVEDVELENNFNIIVDKRLYLSLVQLTLFTATIYYRPEMFTGKGFYAIIVFTLVLAPHILLTFHQFNKSEEVNLVELEIKKNS